MKNTDAQHYRETIKSNLVFGSIKIFKSLITVAQTKIAALFLGPSGIGILTLITSTISTIHQFTTCGIYISGVRQIVLNENEKKTTIKVLDYLALIFGLIGTLICAIFATTISEFVFGVPDYKLWFIIMSMSLLFESVANSQIAIFQGLRSIRKLAFSSVVGAFISLLISFPLYYIWKTDAIPYVILSSYFVIMLVYYFYRRKIVNLRGVRMSKFIFKTESLPIIKLGAVLVLSSIFMTSLVFIQNTLIQKIGSTEDVGLYQASQMCSYYILSVIIAIISTDFYPRITSKINDKNYVKNALNQQIEILVIVVAIISAIIIFFPEFIVKVLYSKDFLSIVFPLQIMSLSLLFRVIWHTMSYIILAHGDKKSYLIYDTLIGNGFFFLTNILGYYIDGIEGISISYFIGSIVVSTMLILVVKIKYLISLSNTFYKRFSILGLHVLILFFSVQTNIYLLSIFIFISLVLTGFILFNNNFNMIAYLKSYFRK